MRMVSKLNRAPTGCCIQALAIRIQSAERFDAERDQPSDREMADFRQPIPAEEEQADEGRLEEERHQPSMASGAPKMSPT